MLQADRSAVLAMLYATDIEAFWEAMEAPPSCQKDFKALHTRITEPAVAAISAKAGMLVEWKPLRAGSRRVTGLEFRFKSDQQGKLDIEDADDEQLSPLETAALNALDNSDNDK